MYLLAFSALSAFIGVSGFVTFLILGNYPSAVWAVLTGLISCCITHLRWLEFNKKLNQWYSAKELIPLSYVGFVCFLAGLMGVGYHTTIEVLLKKPILPFAESEVLPIVWSFLTAKSGIFLMITANSYSERREDEETFVNEEVIQNNVESAEEY